MQANPGAVGVDGTGKAKYAIIERPSSDEKGTITIQFRGLPFDKKRLLDKVHEAYGSNADLAPMVKLYEKHFCKE